jgi:hypothetical protein
MTTLVQSASVANNKASTKNLTKQFMSEKAHFQQHVKSASQNRLINGISNVLEKVPN